MPMRIMTKLNGLFLYSVATLLCAIVPALKVGTAQSSSSAPIYPAHLPYSFGNFIWWSDDELRGLLKKRIPGLSDEIATTTAAEGRVRDALKALLREKGIPAEIQSIEPSSSSFGAQWDPEASGPSIEFSIVGPKILLEKVTMEVSPANLSAVVQPEGPWGEGKEFSSFGGWFIRSRIKNILHQNGYLDAKVKIGQPTFRRDEDQFLVQLDVSVDAGPLYHVSGISADGGPLFQGKDLSPLYGMKAGDVPGRFPLGRLAGQLHDYYLHYGYADVDVKTLPLLYQDKALVAYRLEVIPGPVYHLRTLTVNNLNPDQETRVRDLLGMRQGDIYLDEAITGLYRKIADEPSLKGYRFSFGPKKDKVASQVDLNLDFFKEGNESSVTIK